MNTNRSATYTRHKLDAGKASGGHLDEILIEDNRGTIRPAEMVDIKLSDMMQGAYHLVSQLRFKELIGRRTGR